MKKFKNYKHIVIDGNGFVQITKSTFNSGVTIKHKEQDENNIKITEEKDVLRIDSSLLENNAYFSIFVEGMDSLTLRGEVSVRSEILYNVNNITIEEDAKLNVNNMFYTESDVRFRFILKDNAKMQVHSNFDTVNGRVGIIESFNNSELLFSKGNVFRLETFVQDSAFIDAISLNLEYLFISEGGYYSKTVQPRFHAKNVNGKTNRKDKYINPNLNIQYKKDTYFYTLYKLYLTKEKILRFLTVKYCIEKISGQNRNLILNAIKELKGRDIEDFNAIQKENYYNIISVYHLNKKKVKF